MEEIYNDASLIKKALLDSLNEKEQQQLDELLKDSSLKEIIKQLQNKDLLETSFQEYEKYSSQKAFIQFKKRNKHLRKRKNLYIISSSIAALFIIVSGILIWFTPQTDISTPNLKSSNTLPAGETKAHLTLADGSKIAITSQDSLFLQEGDVNIEAQQGILAYKSQIPTQTLKYNQLEVPKGGECIIELSDGTQVWINSASKLTYPVSFIGNERKVKLQGEAFFQVTKNKKPFIVETSYGSIHVLGTSFNVSAYPEDSISHTTLITGKISMTVDNKSLTITPGEQIIVTNEGNMQQRHVNTDEYAGWKDGKWIFRNRRLEDIAHILERWYDISITFENEALKEILFTGYLERYENANIILDALVRTEELNYKIKNNHVILK